MRRCGVLMPLLLNAESLKTQSQVLATEQLVRNDGWTQ